MSWIVQNLLTNSVRIKERSTSEQTQLPFNTITNMDLISTEGNPLKDGESLFDTYYGYDDYRITSDEYNDLLIIDKAIKELRENNLLSEYEVNLINLLRDGSYKKDVSKRLGKSRRVVIYDFDAICDRIAFYIGGYFTDEGYISYVANKYKLTNDQERTLRDYIKSNHRHKNMKNPFHTKGEK